MIAPIIIAAAVTAASAYASSKQQASAASGASSQARAHAINMDSMNRERFVMDREYDRQRMLEKQSHDDYYENTKLLRLTNDAKAAGLHPAFAMGGPGYTPTQQHVGGGQMQQSDIGQSPTGSLAGRGIANMGEIAAGAIMGVHRQKRQDTLDKRSSKLFDLEVQQREQSLQRDSLEFLAKANEMKRAEQAAIASPTALGEMLKPAEPESKRHPIVNLPLLGRVRLKRGQMTGGGATEQVGEGADYLYGIDLIKRAIVQKLQKSSWNRRRLRRRFEQGASRKWKRLHYDTGTYGGS